MAIRYPKEVIEHIDSEFGTQDRNLKVMGLSILGKALKLDNIVKRVRKVREERRNQ